MDKTLHILIVEDLETDAALAEREIKSELPSAAFKLVETRDDFIEALETFKPDIIVSDYQMPAFDGITALRITLEKAPLTPFIMHTGSMNEDTAVECMKAGATDYVIKEHIKRLGPAVKNALRVKHINLEKMKAQQALIESENRFRRLAENADDLIYRYELHPEQKFTYVSPSATKITGFTPDEHYTDPQLGYKLIHPDDRKILSDTVNKMSNGPSSVVLRWFKKDGIMIWIEQKNVPVFDDIGRLIAIEGIARDITLSKLSEEELKMAKEKAEESDRLKSAFLANMSHEIRTPMNGILGFAELLKQPNLSGDQQQKFVRIIEKSSKRMLNIINDLVEISKIESGHIELNFCDTDINKQLRYVVDFFSPEINRFKGKKRLHLVVPIESTCIYTDQQKLIAILSNLVNNAIKYSDSGIIEVGYSVQNELIEFFVKDEGIGIPTEKIASIFHRFVQADTSLSSKYEGAGLGLSIAKAYTEMLGGKIWAESEPGKGSTFYFSLPNKPHDPAENKTNSDNALLRANGISNKLKVLIVEDDPSSYDLLYIMLEDHIRDCIHANSGKDAVNMVKTFPDIDLVLMDIKMPDMNGYEATRIIREFNKDIVIIAQTAYALTGDREKALEAGCNDHITKPLRQKDLIKVIRKYFF
jgi:PAS domain S-box-containing protein